MTTSAFSERGGQGFVDISYLVGLAYFFVFYYHKIKIAVLKILAHFRSKVLVDFLHYVTRINCLTGAIISETHTTNKYI